MHIKELLQRCWASLKKAPLPKLQKKNLQRVGVLILGLTALLGVSQASSIQRLLTAVRGDISLKSPQPAQKAYSASKPVSTAITSEQQASPDNGSTAPTIVDLISESEAIIQGMTKEVTDGFENGVPYTQVTIQVNEAFRGQVGDEYTFRQFGLMQPRKMENGKTYLGVTPAGWAKYKVGEEAVFFFYKKAEWTGLRTTTGLGQGKLNIAGGNVTSQFDNVGLFANVEVDSKLLNDRDKRLLATKRGPVNKESFTSLVRRAVSEKWIEGRKMRNAKK